MVRLDVKLLRQSLGLTQGEFARRYRLSLSAVRNWEQGKREPKGPSASYLLVIQKIPKTVAGALAQ